MSTVVLHLALGEGLSDFGRFTLDWGSIFTWTLLLNDTISASLDDSTEFVFFYYCLVSCQNGFVLLSVLIFLEFLNDFKLDISLELPKMSLRIAAHYPELLVFVLFSLSCSEILLMKRRGVLMHLGVFFSLHNRQLELLSVELVEAIQIVDDLLVDRRVGHRVCGSLAGRALREDLFKLTLLVEEVWRRLLGFLSDQL